MEIDFKNQIPKKSIFNKEVATKFKDNLLSKGGNEFPMELTNVSED
jgi:Zn-dependent oligopeptidase